jgi:hypothetical protein
MFKQFLLIVILTAVAVFFMKELAAILYVLAHLQNFLINEAAALLPKDTVFMFISKLIILIAIPILIGLLIAFIHWLIKRKEMPRLIDLIWILWVISLLIFVLQK